MSAEDKREQYVMRTGLPSATKDDEAQPRCDFDGGFYVRAGLGGRGDQVCEHCGLTKWEVEETYRRPQPDPLFREDGGRYGLWLVQLDGNPQQVARVTTLAAALTAAAGLRWAWYGEIRLGRATAFVTDLNDEERGHLDEDSYVPGLDVGPDPLEEEV